MCPANRKPPRRTVFLLTFREIDENSRGSEFDKEEPGETEVSPFLRRRSGGADSAANCLPLPKETKGLRGIAGLYVLILSRYWSSHRIK